MYIHIYIYTYCIKNIHYISWNRNEVSSSELYTHYITMNVVNPIIFPYPYIYISPFYIHCIPTKCNPVNKRLHFNVFLVIQCYKFYISYIHYIPVSGHYIPMIYLFCLAITRSHFASRPLAQALAQAGGHKWNLCNFTVVPVDQRNGVATT